ncbi:MAG: hypothetical protein EYC62_02525 [Alphaproteobacteria bacterium]|nr:MAG: hypothetical protein EYC62_02525 [Alphaproteobacteria bacterium]
MSYIIGLDPTDRSATPLHKAGSVGMDSTGAEYIYVQAGATINSGDCVAVDSSFSAQAITKTLADTLPIVGFAQAAFTSGNWGWVARRGVGVRGNMLANTTVNVPLYTTGTAGHLSHVSTSQTMVHGVCATTTSGSNATQTLRASVSPSVIRGTVNA